MKRREFLKTGAAVAGATVASRLGFAQPITQPGPKPNVIFILVDELRWPSAFPVGVNSPEDYFRRFMPNVYRNIWKGGVKFSNYHTAACACTPARGTIITGLYSHQNWLMSTLINQPHTPVLNPAFPTFGKLLRSVGYTTPYVGKWHVSLPSGPADTDPYGFSWDSPPDPVGFNLQGTYGDTNVDPPFHNDAYATNQALDYLQKVGANDAPWFLTIGYVNPHDREFFPAGTEFLTFTNLFDNYNRNKPPSAQLAQQTNYTCTPPIVNWNTNKLKSPPQFGYPFIPPNWQNPNNYAAFGKPTTHTFVQQFSAMIWGDISPNPFLFGFNVVPYANANLGFGTAIAPFYYWQRGLDSYPQVTQLVDQQIGIVLDQLHKLPQSVIDNTIIIFAADHGEYSGAHGFVQGKIGTVYEECTHIPLIVMDPSGRFTGDTNTIRTGLCSSVDLFNMFVTLGNKGDTSWLSMAPYDQIYSNRLDMYSMLHSRWAPGRDHLLFATDEVAPNYFNFNNAPTNILALRTNDAKVGVYADWKPLSADIDPNTVQLEFYDYSTRAGRDELISQPKDPRAQEGCEAIINNYLPNELAAPLPGNPLDPSSLRFQQLKSKAAHIAFRDLIKNQPDSTWRNDNGLRNLLGYGGQF